MAARLERALKTLTFGPVPAFDRSLDMHTVEERDARGAGGAQHLHAQLPAVPAQPPQFEAELLTNTVIGEHTSLGVDYSNVCFTHEWASLPTVSKTLAEHLGCPDCEAARERVAGRKRYRELTTRLVLVGC